MKYSEYRKQRAQGETLTLPSGLEVRVKKVSLMALAFNGDIPQTLHPLTDDLLNKGKDIQVNAGDLAKYGDLVALVVKACLIDPPIADESDEDHISIKDMEAEDKTAIFTWANRGASQLEKFRPEQAGDVGDAQPGNGNGHAPLQVAAPA